MSDETKNNELLAKWVAGELSPEESKELIRTLSLKDLKVVLEDIDTWFVETFNAEEKLEELKEKVERPSKKGKLISLPTILRYAAVVLLAISIYFIINYSLNRNVVQVETTAAEQLEYYLPDSSLVILSPLSSFSFDAKAYMKNREIDLKGQAYFEVRRGALFSVQSKSGEVNVLGTRFEVKETERSYRVNCYDGTVQVMIAHEGTILNALEGLEYRNNTRHTYGLMRNNPSWITGYSSYVKADLREVVADLNRYYKTEIVLPQQYKALKFTGAFSQHDLKTALREVFGPMGIIYTLEKDNAVTFD